MSLRRELDDILRVARDAGCLVHRCPGGHWRITTPEEGDVFTASSPSDYRGIKNLRAHLRRKGIQFPGDGQRRKKAARRPATSIPPADPGWGVLECLRDGSWLTTEQIAWQRGASLAATQRALMQLSQQGQVECHVQDGAGDTPGKLLWCAVWTDPRKT